MRCRILTWVRPGTMKSCTWPPSWRPEPERCETVVRCGCFLQVEKNLQLLLHRKSWLFHPFFNASSLSLSRWFCCKTIPPSVKCVLEFFRCAGLCEVVVVFFSERGCVLLKWQIGSTVWMCDVLTQLFLMRFFQSWVVSNVWKNIPGTGPEDTFIRHVIDRMELITKLQTVGSLQPCDDEENNNNNIHLSDANRRQWNTYYLPSP